MPLALLLMGSIELGFFFASRSPVNAYEIGTLKSQLNVAQQALLRANDELKSTEARRDQYRVRLFVFINGSPKCFQPSESNRACHLP